RFTDLEDDHKGFLAARTPGRRGQFADHPAVGNIVSGVIQASLTIGPQVANLPGLLSFPDDQHTPTWVGVIVFDMSAIPAVDQLIPSGLISFRHVFAA